MISINQIIDIIESMAQNHDQVMSFAADDIWNMGSIPTMTKINGQWVESASNEIKYPILWMVPAGPKPITTTKPSDGTAILNYNLTFVVSDIVYADISNKNDVISDTMQIATDILAQLNDPEYADQFFIDPKSTLTPFEESKNDDLAVGWVVSANIQIAYLRDRCAVPAVGHPNS